MDISTKTIENVISHFRIAGELIHIQANKEGHINSTFISTFNNHGTIYKYTHQGINTNVFKHPFEVMENIDAVTSHIRQKLLEANVDVNQRCLQVVPTHDNSLLYEDSAGGYWRTYHYIDNVKTYATIKDEEQARLLGEAIGQFQLQLSDFNGTTLHSTIPHFHDMALRYEQLENAIKNNHDNRIIHVGEELSFLQANKQRGQILNDK